MRTPVPNRITAPGEIHLDDEIVPGVFNKKWGVEIPYKLFYALSPKDRQELFSPEDAIIQQVFKELGIIRPSYLDIGANDPLIGSNTYLLYLKGSRGINVEPNPDFAGMWEYQRPDDLNLSVGIGVQSGDAEYYEIEGKDQLNTFSVEEVTKAIARGHRIKNVSRVALLSLSDLINTHNKGVFPDFLSIDIEGSDEAILRTMPEAGTSRPKVVCAETVGYTDIPGESVRNTDLIDFMIEDGFKIFDEAGYNTIFVRP
jgi:FkbM family methyltransferase